MEEDIQNYSTCFVGQPVPYIYVDTETEWIVTLDLSFRSSLISHSLWLTLYVIF